jgi:uncharacterized membrane protein
MMMMMMMVVVVVVVVVVHGRRVSRSHGRTRSRKRSWMQLLRARAGGAGWVAAS